MPSRGEDRSRLGAPLGTRTLFRSTRPFCFSHVFSANNVYEVEQVNAFRDKPGTDAPAEEANPFRTLARGELRKGSGRHNRTVRGLKAIRHALGCHAQFEEFRWNSDAPVSVNRKVGGAPNDEHLVKLCAPWYGSHVVKFGLESALFVHAKSIRLRSRWNR